MAPVRRRWWLPPAAALLWASLIAASSSTVILRREWFAWINAHVLRDEASIRWFAWFWGVTWFVFVKGWHATEFAVLFLLVRAALNRATGVASARNLLVAMVTSIAFAASDEWHQTFVPGRGGNLSDVLIDTGGIVLAAFVVWRRSRGRPDGRSSATSGG